MNEFQQQVQQLSHHEFRKQLPEWLTEASRKDMNSQAAMRDLLGRVFTRGVKVGIELAQKVEKGEL